MTVSFRGWEIYPSNLSFSALEVDASRCHEHLRNDAKRLFVSNKEDIDLNVLQFSYASDTQSW